MTINRLNQDVTYLPAFRNLIINGAMQVAQRGTSVTGITTTGYYTVDRWSASGANLGTFTQSVENDAPTGSGFRKSLKMLCTTADATPIAGGALNFRQLIEGQNLQAIRKGTSSAQQLTLSFWVKSNVTGTYIAELVDNDNTRAVSVAYTVNSSGTWEKKTITFPADTTGVLDNDNNNSFQVNWWLGAGTDRTSGTLQTSWGSRTEANIAVGQTNLAAATNNYWQVTGVQLEVGAVATPFEFKPIDTELAQCQRYYYSHVKGDALTISGGWYQTSSQIRGAITFPTSMRIAPSLIDTVGTNYYLLNVNAASDTFDGFEILFASSNTAAIYSDSGVASGTAGQAGHLYTNNASASIAFSAEL
jgi:hypothetical protein